MIPRLAPLAAVLCWGALACLTREPGPGTESAEESAPEAATADSILGARLPPAPPSAPVVLEDRTGVEPFRVVLRTTGQDGGHARRFGDITRPTALRERSPDLSQYPCTSCHFGLQISMADRRVADAHQNIRPVHPRATGAVCSTCHARDNVEQLVSRPDERVTLDHSYRLCARCHASQVESWSGGAHGKRLNGWAGTRVVMGCPECHDPHAPALEQRIPFRPPSIRSGGGTDGH